MGCEYHVSGCAHVPSCDLPWYPGPTYSRTPQTDGFAKESYTFGATGAAWADIDSDGDDDLLLIFAGEGNFTDRQVWENDREAGKFILSQSLNWPKGCGTCQQGHFGRNPIFFDADGDGGARDLAAVVIDTGKPSLVRRLC